MRIGRLVFSEQIPLVLAPLAGYTDQSFRRICRLYGVDLTVSEMVSADGLVLGRPTSKGRKKTLALLDADADDHPFAAQLFGRDPDRMAEACRVVAGETSADLIDLNAGCPVRKVYNSGHGAALMNDPLHLGLLLAAMRAATDLPLTVKFRAGAERINVEQCARVAEQEGVDAIVVHPRTRAQQFTGVADWTLIARVKQAVRISVIGNGDIHSGRDARRMRDETGCDAIMIGRGAVGLPWIFQQARAALRGEAEPAEPSGEEKLDILRRQLDDLSARKGEELAAKEMRKFALQMVKGQRGAAAARREIATAPTAAKLLASVQAVLADR